MAFNQSHITELLTEGQYATVSVYFENETQASAKNPTPWANNRQESAKALMSQDEAFPFIVNAIPARTYIYKCSIQMAHQLRQGSRVVVPPNRPDAEFRVGKVWQVHGIPQIDFTAKFEYKWLVQALDTSEYDDHMARERSFKALLLEVEKTQEREAIRASIMSSIVPGTEAYAVFEKALRVMGVATTPAPVPAPVQATTTLAQSIAMRMAAAAQAPATPAPAPQAEQPIAAPPWAPAASPFSPPKLG